MSLRLGHDLTLNDLNVVYSLLFRVKAKWKEIGLQLGVRVFILDSIQSEATYRDDGQRLMQVLSEWLRSVTEPPPSWPAVVDALRSEPVREWDVADKVKRKHCPDYVEPESSLWPPPRLERSPTPGRGRSQQTSPELKPNSIPASSPRMWQYGLILIGIALCIVFAAGGIALITVGMMGLSDKDSCSIGPPDTLSSFNLLSGLIFLSGIALVIFFITLWFCDPRRRHAVKVMKGIIIGFIAVSIVVTIGDMIYAFYVASQVLPNVEKWENDTTLCEEAVYRSSFGVIVVFFLIIFAIVTAVASLFSYWAFKKIIHTNAVAECLHLESDTRDLS